MVSAKFLVNDDVVMGATEKDAAASPIVDVSVVQQLRRSFASMDNNLPFVEFDGQLISMEIGILFQ